MEKELTIETKPKFYVFSSIGNTLISNNFIKSYYQNSPFICEDTRPDPNCIKAMNYFLENLETNFDTKLIITSKRRENQSYCEYYLKTYGLKYDKPIFFTKFINGERGEKIVNFLEDQQVSPLTFHTAPLYVKFLKNLKDNSDFQNYVVIDSKRKYLSKFIPQSQIKIVSKTKGFTFEDADEILTKFGIIPKTNENLQVSEK